MTRSFVASLWSALALVPALSAAPVLPPQPPEPPPGPPPRLAFAHVTGGQIVVTATVMEAVPVTRQEVQVVNGKQVTVTPTAYQTVTKTIQQALDMKTTGVYGVDGKEIDKDTLPRLLKDRTAVVVSIDGQKVSPAYLRAFKEGTIVLVPPLPRPANVPVPANPPVPIPKRVLLPKPVDR